MKLMFRLVLIVALIILGIGYYAFYGFTFPPCGEREEAISIPETLKNHEFSFSVQINYTASSHCSKTYKEINREIPYARSKPVVKTTPAGTRYKIEKAFWLKDFGLSALDGVTPKVFLIKDENNNESLVWCGFLKDSFTGRSQDNDSLLDCFK